MRRNGISALIAGLFVVVVALGDAGLGGAAGDPIGIDPDAYAASQRWSRPGAAQQPAPNPPPAGRGLFGDASHPQTVSAQPQSGGGFLEFLFGRAPFPPQPQRVYQRAPDYYQSPVQASSPPPPPSYQPPAGLFALFAPPAYRGAVAPQPPAATPELSPYFVPSSYGDIAHQPVDPKYDRQLVAYDGAETPGTIVVDTPNKFLYLVEGGGRALRYGIGVGKPGFAWAGIKTISAKRAWPDWRPPEEMLERRPDLPRFMAGGPDNPLGARAMYLGSTLYRIHGSNEPWTIGTNVSSGCIRMRNEDVIDLYDRVKVGAKVVVI